MKWYDRYDNTPKEKLSLSFLIFRFRKRWDPVSGKSEMFEMFKAVLPQGDEG